MSHSGFSLINKKTHTAAFDFSEPPKMSFTSFRALLLIRGVYKDVQTFLPGDNRPLFVAVHGLSVHYNGFKLCAMKCWLTGNGYCCLVTTWNTTLGLSAAEETARLLLRWGASGRIDSLKWIWWCVIWITWNTLALNRWTLFSSHV